MSEYENGAKITSEKEALRHGDTSIEIWLKKIAKARSDQEKWVKSSRNAIKVYEVDDDSPESYNIFFSNVETIVPALYNSTPIADVRRRWEEDDEIARCGAEMIERGIVYSLDSYGFDAFMAEIVTDNQLCGRGTGRIRYEPSIVKQLDANGAPMTDSSGEPMQAVAGEMLYGEIVQWDRWGHGPGVVWEQVQFVYFDHDLTSDEVKRIMGITEEEIDKDTEDKAGLAQLAKRKQFKDLNFDDGPSSTDKPSDNSQKGILSTLFVQEVWDKTNRKVIFLTEKDQKQPLAVFDDPMRLKGFFPMPRPMQMVRRRASLLPVVPFDVYKKLVKELERITKRIAKLTESLKVRGLVDGSVANDLNELGKLDDGQFKTASSSGEFLKTQAGIRALADLIHHFPLDPVVQALTQLYQQREECKQAIYEITGISDILRGATNPHETLGAQQLKASWGSQRIQRMQGEVGRYAADMFNLKAEVLCRKFDWEVFKKVTRMTFEPDAPEEVEQTPQMGDNGGPPLGPEDWQSPEGQDPATAAAQAQIQAEMAMREATLAKEEAVRHLLQEEFYSYRIDIESDSTIRADIARNQDQMNQFVTATGLYWQGILPVVQLVPALLPAMVELFGVMAGNFKLGKRGGDILERMREAAKRAVKEGGINLGGPTPQEVAAQQAEQEAAERQQQNDAAQAQFAAEQQDKQNAHDAQESERDRQHEAQMKTADQINEANKGAAESQKAVVGQALERAKQTSAIIKGRTDIQKSIVAERTARVKSKAETIKAVTGFKTALANAKAAKHKADAAKKAAKTMPPGRAN